MELKPIFKNNDEFKSAEASKIPSITMRMLVFVLITLNSAAFAQIASVNEPIMYLGIGRDDTEILRQFPGLRESDFDSAPPSSAVLKLGMPFGDLDHPELVLSSVAAAGAYRKIHKILLYIEASSAPIDVTGQLYIWSRGFAWPQARSGGVYVHIPRGRFGVSGNSPADQALALASTGSRATQPRLVFEADQGARITITYPSVAYARGAMVKGRDLPVLPKQGCLDRLLGKPKSKLGTYSVEIEGIVPFRRPVPEVSP